MMDCTAGLGDRVSRSRIQQPQNAFSRIGLPLVALGLGVWAGIASWGAHSTAPPFSDSAFSDPAQRLASVALAAADPYDALLDPGFSLGVAPLPLGHALPLAAEFRWTTPPPVAAAKAPMAKMDEPPLEQRPMDEPPVQPGGQASAPPSPPPGPPLPTSRLVLGDPLPVPRPAELRAPPVAEAPRMPGPIVSRRTKSAAMPIVQPDNRSFIEKLFSAQRPSGPALAYAAPQDDVADAARGKKPGFTLAPMFGSDPMTAVYDIASRTVRMPNGDKLEAHSGLGDRMDNPRYVHEKMRGATPPHVYDLSLREQPFHGVRALRLNPVGGSGAIHGRVGLLAHTYLLGPKGASNGCVSFKDYDKFLQAYLKGEVRRLVVVAGAN